MSGADTDDVRDSRSVNIADAGEVAHARLRLRDHLEHDPADGPATFLLGLTFHHEGRFEIARRSFERAIELEPDNAPPHHYLGWCLYHLGQPERARTSFETHLRLNPDDTGSHFALGLIALDEHNLDEAERRFRTALRMFRADTEATDARIDTSDAHARLGETLLRRENPRDALAQLDQAVAENPDHYEAQYLRSRAFLKLGDFTAAGNALADYHVARDRVAQRASDNAEE